MPKRFLVPIDLSQNELQNARIQNLATFPGSPVVGQEFYYSGASYPNHAYVFTGTGTVNGGWEQASGASNPGTITSVTMTMSQPSLLTVAGGGSPTNTVTYSSGAAPFTVAFPNQAANAFFAGPTSGGSGAITARSVVAADLGFTMTHAFISDFDNQVHLSSIDQLAVPASAVNLNNQKITNLANPTSSSDGANKGYVDAAVLGTSTKPTANYATTGALPANTYNNGASGLNATLTGNSNVALPAQDGAGTPLVNDIVLVKNEAAGANDGLYVVTAVGSGSAPYVLTRHAQMDSSAEFNGALVAVQHGGQAGSLWLCSANNPTVGTTAINFVQINSQTGYTGASDQITISGGNVIGIASTYMGQTSISALGTVTSGTWNAVPVDVAHGGTNSTTARGSRVNLNAVGQYTQLIGDGTATSWTITQATHGLAANSHIMVQVRDAGTNNIVFADVTVNSSGTVGIVFALPVPTSNQYEVLLIG